MRITYLHGQITPSRRGKFFFSLCAMLLASASLAHAGNPNVSTYHNDRQRTGWNNQETALTPSTVASTSFQKLATVTLDEQVDAQPLYVARQPISGKGVHDTVYVATENNSIYAVDAHTGNILLHRNFGLPVPLSAIPGGCPNNVRSVGINSTPVIDPASGTLYVLTYNYGTGKRSTFRLNALDITTGAQKFGGPVTINASVPGTNSESVNGVVTLTTSCTQRAALLLANNSIYIGFGNCHSGWLLAYNASTLAQTGVFNSSPNLNGEGKYGGAGGVWMSGGGPVADSAGNIYISTGNGPWDSQTSFADSVLKFSATLQLEDYFTPAEYQFMNCDDADLAAGGLMLIPGTSELVAGGKMGIMHVLNTASLGREQAGNAGALQNLWFEGDISAPYSTSCTDSSGTHTTNVSSYEIFGTSAYFNGSVYLGIEPTGTNVPSGIRQFTLSGGMLSPGPYTSQGILLNTPGSTPFISANGTSNGVLWMLDPGHPLQNAGAYAPTSAVLRAYDTNNLSTELYDSSANSGDMAGYGLKFTSPVVGNGKVYITTAHDLTTATNPQGEIDVYGLH